MSYFAKFPTTLYDLTAPGSTTTKLLEVKDIIRRVKLKSVLESNIFAYDPYDIKEGERPDILADQFYGDSDLAWVILLTNEIHDLYEDWPLTERELSKMVAEKYTNPEDLHHYERPQDSGDTSKKVRCCNATNPNTTAVTNREYELRLNEEKRRIKILRREILSDFIEQFEELIRD